MGAVDFQIQKVHESYLTTIYTTADITSCLGLNFVLTFNVAFLRLV